MSTVEFMRSIIAGMKDGDIKKAMIWAELELGERADRIFELEDEITGLYREIDGLRLALQSVKHDIETVAKAVHSALFELPEQAVDKAPWKNINAHWERTGQVEPVKKKRKVKEIA